MIKKLRIWSWIVSAFIKKYAIGITIGTIAGVILVVYFDPILKMLPITNTQHIGRIGSFTLAQLPLDIQQQVSSGLTKINQKGDWVADVANTVNINQDGTQYTVTINPETTWNDGTPLTTADIELNIADVTIDRPDPQTITFTLQEAFAPFPTILSQPILRKTKMGFIRKKTEISGINEFSITDVETNGQYLKKVILSSGNSVKVYHFYPTEEDALVAFKLGHIDTIEGLSSAPMDQWSNVSIEKEPDPNRYLTLFFNTADPNLQDKTIRQMLAYATPKSTDDDRVISPISRNSWAYNPQVKPYLYNLDTAKEMLDKIVAANPNIELQITLTTTPAYVDIGQQIVDAWNQLGVTANLQIVSFPDTNEYQALLIGQQIPDDPDQYALWHSTQATNIAKYKSPKIDKLIEDGRKETDKDKRKQIYLDFQRFLVEDSPAVFLQELPNFTIARNGALSKKTN